MKKTLLIAALCVAATACGASKQVAQTAPPKTSAQSTAANRGQKMDKEECEEMALAATDNLRAAGNALSGKEAFATNLATLDARANLAQQIEVLVSGMIRNFDQQHEADKTRAQVGKSGQVQEGYFEQFLSNSRVIAKNTYVKEDGSYNVYVCVELDPATQKAMHKKLSEDQIIGIDYQEHLFMEDMAKAKEEYRKKQIEQ